MISQDILISKMYQFKISTFEINNSIYLNVVNKQKRSEKILKIFNSKGLNYTYFMIFFKVSLVTFQFDKIPGKFLLLR